MRRAVRGACIAAMLSITAVAFAQTTGQNPTGAAGQAGSPTMTTGSQTGDRVQTQQPITLIGCVQREAEYRQTAGGRGGALGTGVGVGNEFVLVNASSGAASISQTATSSPGTTPSPTAGTNPTEAPTPTAGTTAGGTATATGTAGTTGATTTGTAGAATTPSTPSPSTASPSTAPRPSDPSAPTSATMTSGGKAYALTGNREKELEQHVGQRVEIIGTVEGGSGASMRGGASAGTTGAGATAGATGGATTGTASGTASGTPPSPTGATASGTMSGSTGASARVGDLQQVNIVSFRAVGGSCSQ